LVLKLALGSLIKSIGCPIVQFTKINHLISDTINVSGTKHNNVKKLKGLKKRTQNIGMGLSIRYKTFSNNKVVVPNCIVVNPIINSLKELNIFNKGEID